MNSYVGRPLDAESTHPLLTLWLDSEQPWLECGRRVLAPDPGKSILDCGSISARHRPSDAPQDSHPVMACQFCPGLVRTVVLVTLVPFMVQITGVPLVFWNRMSALPSPL